MSFDKRYTWFRPAVIVVLTVLVAYFLIQWILSFKTTPKEVVLDEVQRVVSVEEVELMEYHLLIDVLGSIQAEQNIELFAELSGILMSPRFKEGNYFKQGEVLIHLDQEELNQSLKAAKSQLLTLLAQIVPDIKIDYIEEAAAWESYLNTFNINDVLPKLPTIQSDQLKKFIAGKGLLNLYYTVESNQIRLAKQYVKAPFDGVLSEVSVQKGTLVRVGQKLGEFISNSAFEFIAEVSLDELSHLKEGMEVSLFSEALNQTWKGKLSRINAKIDPLTQRVKIYVSLKGVGLKDGMFVNAKIKGAYYLDVYAIDRQQIKDGEVFVVDNATLQNVPVEVIFQDERYAYVKGLNSKQLVLVSNLKGLYKGMKVKTVLKAPAYQK